MLILNSTRIKYNDKRIQEGEGSLTLEESHLPFDITVKSLKEFDVELAGFHYSFTGMRIYIKRNDFDELFGAYYGPTLIFSLLSLVSYAINIDSVSN